MHYFLFSDENISYPFTQNLKEKNSNQLERLNYTSPGESVRAGSNGKTPENGRKVEEVIQWSYPVAGFSRFQPEPTLTARIPSSDMITVLLLPFSGVFPSETTAFPRVPAGNPRNRGPQSLSWVIRFSYYLTQTLANMIFRSNQRCVERTHYTSLVNRTRQNSWLSPLHKQTRYKNGVYASG